MRKKDEGEGDGEKQGRKERRGEVGEGGEGEKGGGEGRRTGEKKTFGKPLFPLCNQGSDAVEIYVIMA